MENINQTRRSRSWQSIKGSPEERTSRALSRLEDITRLVSSWVWEVDTDGRFTFISERLFQSLGIHPASLLGKTFKDLENIQTDGEGKLLPDFKEPFRNFNFEIAGSDGAIQSVQISGIPIYDRETWGYEGACGVVDDLTETLQSAKDLKEAKELAEAANLSKTTFLSCMSHELRTPLNSILGFSQLLRINKEGVFTEKHLQQIEQIYLSGNSMLELVNDILDLARIESGNETYEPEYLFPKTVFEECFDMLEPMAKERNLIITGIPETLRKLFVDRFRLKQTLLNLIGNAIKYNKDGGSVSFGCRDHSPEYIEVYVNDTGLGIEENEIDKIFLPFHRSDSISGKVQGTGVGLSLVKRNVELMNGTIEVSSKLGHGSSFSMLFPACENQTSE